MLNVACLLWTANRKSFHFSRMYDEEWVERLYRGFARNLRQPFRFVCFTDKIRDFEHPEIEQEKIAEPEPDYSCGIEPYRLNEPMILVGLDTIITGSIDHLAEYCLTADKIALPRDPFQPEVACNGVALVPAGNKAVYDQWNGENDMQWMRKQPHVLIDDLFPGQVVSYKGHVKKNGIGDARIVYFHGEEKPHQISDPKILEHWR